MPSCEVDPKALVAVMKTAKAFGSFDEVWLEVGNGKLIFRSGDQVRYAICGVTLPAPGCEGVEPRFLGLLSDKIADVVKGVKGLLKVEWDDAAGESGGRITFRSGTKRRSFLLLAKEGGVPVRNVPDVPGIVTATVNGEDLKRFLGEAEGVGLVWAERRDGCLVLHCAGDTGDELDWNAGPCEGVDGKVASWNAENWGKLLPTEYDGDALVIKFHPRALKMEWAFGGAPCAMAVAPMEDPS